MMSSFEPSTGGYKAQLVKERLITSVGSSAQASKIHCNIRHCRNVRGLGKSMVVFRLFELLRCSNERSTKFEDLYHE